jgi:AcrR family transcriptional regulator
MAALSVPPLGRRERNKREKREKLLAVARRLFAKKGFAATTTAEIAAQADVATGTLFLYFESKEDLLVAIFREAMDEAAAEAFASIPRRARLLDELVHVYGQLVAFHERDPSLARAFVKELLFVNESQRASVNDFIASLTRATATRIEAAKRRGELAPEAPSGEIASDCFALYIVSLQRWLGLAGTLATREHTEHLRRAFGRTLGGFDIPRAAAPR